MKIMYYTTIDNGDGSSSTRFFESQECIDYLEDVNPEAFGAGEGGSWFEYEGTISIIPETLQEVMEEYPRNEEEDSEDDEDDSY